MTIVPFPLPEDNGIINVAHTDYMWAHNSLVAALPPEGSPDFALHLELIDLSNELIMTTAGISTREAFDRSMGFMPDSAEYAAQRRAKTQDKLRDLSASMMTVEEQLNTINNNPTRSGSAVILSI